MLISIETAHTPLMWCHLSISCCMISQVKKEKKTLTDTGNCVLCYNCEIVYNNGKYLLLHLLLVQQLTGSVLILGLKKLLLNIKIYLIESVEVPLEFNIIF